MRVEVLGPDGWRAWRDLRLEALADTPIGFGELHVDALEYSDADWQARLLRPGFYAIAYADGHAIGMAGGYRRDDGQPVLVGVYVRPQYRGQDVLAALVDAVAAWAAPDALVLDVHEDNERAHRAYLKLGFVDTGERRVGAGIDGRDLLGMHRR